MCYLCANFGLPRPLCSRRRPDVHDRQTDVRQKHRLMPPPIRGGGIIMQSVSVEEQKKTIDNLYLLPFNDRTIAIKLLLDVNKI